MMEKTMSNTTTKTAPNFDPSAFLANKPIMADQPQPRDDRRRAPRYRMAIPALMEFALEQTISVTITDMSLVGFACDSRQIFTPGTNCWLRLPALPNIAPFDIMKTRIVRCDGNRMGCAFAQSLTPEQLEPFLTEYMVAA